MLWVAATLLQLSMAGMVSKFYVQKLWSAESVWHVGVGCVCCELL